MLQEGGEVAILLAQNMEAERPRGLADMCGFGGSVYPGSHLPSVCLLLWSGTEGVHAALQPGVECHSHVGSHVPGPRSDLGMCDLD